ncbi:MAG TPA: hypothetical protein VHS03_02055 [Gaiellaceae bacterium]|nr:hypothetical protein [Gaiellaceae bacterium]
MSLFRGVTTRARSQPREPTGNDAPPFTHVFSVLVHENTDCVFDLVRNLRFFDRDSPIVLYDGSDGGGLLLDSDALEKLGAVVHPAPRHMPWCRAHGYVFDCLEYALDHYEFDALTAVDSDQLLIRHGYPATVQKALADRPRAGLLATPHPTNLPGNRIPIPPDVEQWESMRTLLGYRGKPQLPIWIFWPGTVFTGAASKAICAFRDDPTLADVLERSNENTATEEVVFSTLAALLGYEVVQKPWNDRFVRWRPPLLRSDVAEALVDPGCYWLHPVRRDRDDPARAYLRRACNDYHRFTPLSPGQGT